MTATTPDHDVAALTGPLLDWSASVDFDDLPAEVVHAARRAVIDSLGVTLGGSQTEATTILLDLADELSGAPVATVVGHRRRVDVVTATMVNGVSAHVLDFDDTLIPTRIHASAPLLPALLAVGQTQGSTYRDLLAAFVVGFELQARLALAMYPDYADRGWHGTSVVAPMAVATAAGRLLRLDPGRLAHAAGLGITQGAGITAVFGSMAKSLNLGRAGASGVQGRCSPRAASPATRPRSRRARASSAATATCWTPRRSWVTSAPGGPCSRTDSSHTLADWSRTPPSTASSTCADAPASSRTTSKASTSGCRRSRWC